MQDSTSSSAATAVDTTTNEVGLESKFSVTKILPHKVELIKSLHLYRTLTYGSANKSRHL